MQSVHPPVHWLPAEIHSDIFRLIMENGSDLNRVQVMLVCRRWHDTMVSTPGIVSLLSIEKSTTVQMVRAAIQGMRWLLHVSIGEEAEKSGQDLNEDGFDACFKAAIEAASRWKDLEIYSIPQSRKFKAFQILLPLTNLEYVFLGCDLGRYFEPIMTAITTTATPPLTEIVFHELDAVLYLMQPDCLHVFGSLTILSIWLSERIENPTNILPLLQRLEEFYAGHLHLPFYPPDAPLPLLQTLRELVLRSVSVQWMAGRVFPVLWYCKITFPHHIDTICLQPVTMPACTDLTYDSNDLGPLRYFHGLPLSELDVTSGQWSVMRGNHQLIAICCIVVPNAERLTKLDLQVRCSGQLLIYMLRLLPALEALQLRLDSPRALNEAFFEAFVATKSNADSPCEIGAVPRLPLCSQLEELIVKYKRWLRGSERTALLPVFSDIVSSRFSEKDFRLSLRFEGLLQDWTVWVHVESVCEIEDDDLLMLGISTPHGIIPLVSYSPYRLRVTEVPFKEAEYLVAGRQLSIECLATLHHLVELRIGGEKDILPSTPPPTLPLFHTLRVFEAKIIHPSFLAGQTFHMLERCRISSYVKGPALSQDQVTLMPVCTRLDVEDLTLLATLKLPQIRELGASFDTPEFSMLWETQIAVKTNLSGLKLLHVHGWYQQVDLIQVLRCLPVLESLILANGTDLDAAFFGGFVSMHPNETTGLLQSHHEGQASAILCPMLRSLLIEECGATERVEELIPVLKQVVTLREVCGSPLERFNLASFEFGREFELIGSEGGFVAEMEPLDEDAESFELDI